jgi:hypothetical protein
LKSVIFSRHFGDLGYIWIDNSIVTIKSVSSYSFGQESVNFGNDIGYGSSLVNEADECSIKELTPLFVVVFVR